MVHFSAHVTICEFSLYLRRLWAILCENFQHCCICLRLFDCNPLRFEGHAQGADSDLTPPSPHTRRREGSQKIILTPPPPRDRQAILPDIPIKCLAAPPCADLDSIYIRKAELNKGSLFCIRGRGVDPISLNPDPTFQVKPDQDPGC